MINDKLLDAIIKSVRFELLGSDIGIVKDAPWRRAGFSRSYHTIIILKNGGFFFSLNRNSKKCVIHEGDCAYIPAGVWRQNGPMPKDSKAILRFCNFNFYIFDNLDFLSFFQLPTCFTSQATKRISDIIKSFYLISKDAKMNNMIKSIEEKSLSLSLLSSLLQEAEAKPHFTKFTDNADRLTKVLDYISQNYNHKVSLKKLASIACLSPSAFHRTFKETIGIPPMRFLREQQMNEARHLLITTSLSLAEIAEKLAFSNPFSFSKCFKKICGQSPREYRQTSKKEFGEI